MSSAPRTSYLHCFPDPYPDECWYSVLCRAFVRSGEYSSHRFVSDLFGYPCSLRASLFAPLGIRSFESWFKDAADMRRRAAFENSALPYLSVAFPPSRFSNMLRWVRDGTDNSRTIRDLAVSYAPRSSGQFLRFCPACASADKRKYGEYYWHREPQLPGVVVCSEHEVSLRNTPIQVNRIRARLFPASRYLSPDTGTAETQFLSNADMVRYRAIARDTMWLLQNGVSFGGSEGIAQRYKPVLRTQGWLSSSGKIEDPRHFDALFHRFHTSRFLRTILNTEHHPAWMIPCDILHYSFLLSPLRHILVMEFLVGSVSSLAEYKGTFA